MAEAAVKTAYLPNLRRNPVEPLLPRGAERAWVRMMATARDAYADGHRITVTTPAAKHTGTPVWPFLDVLNLNVDGAILAIPISELVKVKILGVGPGEGPE